MPLTTWVALLRGVNLGGHKAVAMADLRTFATKLGLEQPATLLQSGNLVFRSAARGGAPVLERLLEKEAATRLRLETDFHVRSAGEWLRIVNQNPFPEEAQRDPSHLLVVCLKDAPAAARVKALEAAITGPEVVRADGRQAYIVYPAGIGRSRLTTALIDAKLGTRGTGRNWNTVLKLAALVSG